MLDLPGFVPCRRCHAGSDDNSGAELVCNACVCRNEACAFVIRIRGGAVFFTSVEVRSTKPPPPHPSLPAPSPNGTTWQAFRAQP